MSPEITTRTVVITLKDEITVTDETADAAAELLMKSKWTLQKCRKWGQLHHPYQDFTKVQRVLRDDIYRCKSCDHTVSECDMRKVRGLWDVFKELAGIREIIDGCHREKYRVFLQSQYVTDTEIVIANRIRNRQTPGNIDVARLVKRGGGWETEIDYVPEEDGDSVEKSGDSTE